MSAQVTIKMSTREFDDTRKAIGICIEHSRAIYVQLKAEKVDRDAWGPWYNFAVVCERLLEQTFS